MIRIIALIAAIGMVFVLGCKGDGTVGPVDPFGRTTIDPPRTGAVGMYSRNRAIVGSRPGSLPPPASTWHKAESGMHTVPPPNSTSPSSQAPTRGYLPPDASYDFNNSSTVNPHPFAQIRSGNHFLGDQVRIPTTARDLDARPNILARNPRANDWPNSADFDGEWSASHEWDAFASQGRTTRTLAPRPTQPSNASIGPCRVVPRNDLGGRIHPGGSVDLVDSARTDSPRFRPADSSSLQFASANVPVARPRTAGNPPNGWLCQSGSFSPHAKHGFDPSYRWLRGQLEYSRIDHRWRLRYIPIDGQTDDFGGSVVISNTLVLSGCERGDFVEVHGQLGSTTPDRSFAPGFEVHQIRRLGRD